MNVPSLVVASLECNQSAEYCARDLMRIALSPVSSRISFRIFRACSSAKLRSFAFRAAPSIRKQNSIAVLRSFSFVDLKHRLPLGRVNAQYQNGDLPRGSL